MEFISKKTNGRESENHAFEFWNKCLEESAQINLEYDFDEKGERKILTPRMVNEKGEKEFSRLPEIYAKVVRTPGFFNWFGDWTQLDKTNVSKVVHSDTGEPMIVFHGARSLIEDELGLKPQLGYGTFFDETYSVKSSKIYFTSYPDIAKNFSTYGKANGGVYCVFLNIKKPIRTTEVAVKLKFKLEEGYDGFDDYGIDTVDQAEQYMHIPSPVQFTDKFKSQPEPVSVSQPVVNKRIFIRDLLTKLYYKYK